MSIRSTGRQGSESLESTWARWARAHAEMLEKATSSQRVLLEAAVRFVTILADSPLMRRVAAFFLLHAGMGLTPAQVGAAVGRTDRAMRTVQGLSAREFLESIWRELGRHRQPKLHAEHAGPIAKYLVDHPDCTQAEVVAFLARELGIHVDPQTLRRFFKTYGLGALRAESTTVESAEAPRPFV